MKKLLQRSLALLALLMLMTGSAGAEEAKLFLHESVDKNTVTLIARDELYSMGTPVSTLLELHKVMKKEQGNYYALRICVIKDNAAETPIANCTLLIDGVEQGLSPLSNARRDLFTAATQQWYDVDENLLNKIANAKKIMLKLAYTTGKVRKDDVDTYFIDEVKRIGVVTADNYRQQKRIIEEKNDYVVFIPAVNAKQLGPAIIYRMNYDQFAKKETLRPDYYRVLEYGGYKYLAFYQELSRSDQSSFKGWFRMKETPAGTWVMVDLMEEDKFYSWSRMDSNGKSEIMKLYRADDMLQSLIWATQTTHGRYDYGIEWEPILGEKDSKSFTRREWHTGPFSITKVDGEATPAVADVAKGDKIISINGQAAQDVTFIESKLRTACSGETLKLTVLDSKGVKREIIIQPKFYPAQATEKNYQALFEKERGMFDGTFYGYPDKLPASYDPLSTGIYF